MAVDLASILPLPATFADDSEAAFAPLAGEAPLVRVARTMLGAAVVAVAEPLVDRVCETLAAQSLSAVGAVAADNPGSRAHCLAAGLRYFNEPPRYVLIHDIRRPLAPASLRDRVVRALEAGHPIVMPALAVTDSVKAVDSRGSVTGTVDRSTLRSVQFPRGFTVEQLSRLLAGRTSDDFDELSESLRAGTPITLVDGDAGAFDVELPRDIAYVEAIIECRLPADG
jgi:2-C-methyl-D-erythritol 4-phosphate cytidylyltransferase